MNSSELRGNAAAQKIRVMVVDRHQLMRRAIAAVINAETDMLCCGEVAMNPGAVTEILRCRPDVVLIDVSGRGGAGLEAVRRVRAHSESVRIIAMAMSERADYMARSLDVGVAAFVAKGGMASRLLETVRRTAAKTDNRAEETPAEGSFVPRRRVNVVRTRIRSSMLDSVEREIVELVGRGLPARSIAARLGMNVAAIEAHRRRIRSKLNFPTPTQLVQFCVQWVERKTLPPMERKTAT